MARSFFLRPPPVFMGCYNIGVARAGSRCVDEPRPGMSDPCMLSPELRAQGGGDGGGASVGRSPQAGLAYSKECAAWSMPSIMAAINSKVEAEHCPRTHIAVVCGGCFVAWDARTGLPL